MCWVLLRWEARVFLISCSVSTRACLLLSRMFITLWSSKPMLIVNSVALAVGAVAERGRMLPCIIYMFVWTTIIYDPIACWTWNSSGWVFQMGGLDFAGGTPVHIASGCAALAYSYMLGKRSGHGTVPTTSRTLLSALYSSGWGGSASTLVRLCLLTYALSWLLYAPILLPVLVVLPGA